MAISSPHISDVSSLEHLNDKIKNSCEAMSGIDQSVIQHIYGVRETLARQLRQIRMKLDEAERQLDQASSAMHHCHASQYRNQDGDIVPSCSYEERAVDEAQKVAEMWRRKHHRAQQIFDECRQEIDDYLSGGHEFIQDMRDLQYPKISKTLSEITDRLQAILSANVTL